MSKLVIKPRMKKAEGVEREDKKAENKEVCINMEKIGQ